jgi:pimeloyl-ACP methyl ester carboxylesterase
VSRVLLGMPRKKGRFFDSEGARIHFTDEGSGEPVVLVHGFAVNADLNWRLPGIMRTLRRRFRVVAMDMRGHGLSDKPHGTEHYGLCMVADVRRLLDELQIERAHVVGYSLGGFVVLKLATLEPSRLISASILGAGWEQPARGAFMDGLARLADEIESTGSVGPISANLGSSRRRPSLRHRIWVRLVTRLLNEPAALAAVIRSTPELGVTEAELAAIELPVCSIVGEHDPLLEGARALRGRVRRLTHLVVPRADHLQAPLRSGLQQGLLQFLRGARSEQ